MIAHLLYLARLLLGCHILGGTLAARKRRLTAAMVALKWTPQAHYGIVAGDADTRKGYWQNDKPHGKGKYIFSSGKVFKGPFLQGNMHGSGMQKMC